MKNTLSILAWVIIMPIFFFFNTDSANATIYYVSSSGNDGNNGTSQATPWQTINKVNSTMASRNPGDQILFNKGDRFYGSISIVNSGAAGNEIIFGSYGTGNLPMITGKKIITGWTVYSGNIYKATLSAGDTVTNLYNGDNIMTIARFPNSGFLRTDYSGGNTGFYDAELSQAAGYWNGADCRIRTINWAYEKRTVSNFSGGNVTFSSPTVYSAYTDYGYYFDNKLILLDAQNEFYFDKAASILYFYAPGGVNPNTLSIEATVLRNAFSFPASKSYIKIQNLNITGYSQTGVNAPSADHYITVQDCRITQTLLYGISINGLGQKILNNTFEDNLNVAVSGVMTNGLIKNNVFNRTGMIAGYGGSGSGSTAISGTSCTSTTIEANNIDSSGYNGIGAAKNCVIKNNIINYSCVVLNDGGGIDIIDCDTLQILNNIIYNTIGNYATSGVSGTYSSGIYINGAVMKNSTIQGNTVCYSRYMGIQVDHRSTAVNNKILDNTCYNNFTSQILFTDYSAGSFVPVYNDVIKKNIFYSLSAGQNTLDMRGHTSSGISDFGTFDSNYYCNPYSEFLVRRTRFAPTYTSSVYTLPYWQTNYAEDPHSHSLPFTFEQYGITDTLSGNMITNSKFMTNTTPWQAWPVGLTIGWQQHPQLDSGSMRIRWNGSGNSIGLDLSNHYPITQGYSYLISLNAVGNQNGSFNLWGLSSLGSTIFTFPQTFFNYSTYTKNFSLIYKAEITDPSAFMSIGMLLPDSLVYVDNVSMYRVSVDKIDSTQKSKIFINENSFAQSISLNGIPYSDLDGSPVSGSILLQPYSSRILVNGDVTSSRTLTLKALFEGRYNINPGSMAPDTATVYLRDAASPYSIADSSSALLDQNGDGSFNFTKAVNSVNYYIVVKHRNSLETWSAAPMNFISDQLNYDFTTGANTAYGNNLILKGTKYCIYSGDVINNGMIELTDVLQISNASSLFTNGYVAEDVNGDGNVDLDDIGIAYNNTINFISVSKP